MCDNCAKGNLYSKVSTDLNFVEREKSVVDFWKKNDIFKKSVKLREGHPTFMFYDGPPTANGKPHIGHIETRVFKDVVPRFWTMKGYEVPRKAGWDTHGLPVELEVEKMLGINGKPQIEEYGVEPFIKKCKESVWKYKHEWEEMSDRVGFWADMDNPYVTYENNYIESVWWALKTISDKGLLYKGHKVVPYCPRCGTSLSSHEVAQGYKDVKETSCIAKFKVKNEENTYILAWTTTPWTLPSNTALCVNAHEEYVVVKVQDGTKYILAEALASSVIKEEFEVVRKCLGAELIDTDYEPLYDFAKPNKRAWFVVADDYVTLTDGTGIVHIAPAFGEDDARVGRDNDLPFIQLVDEQGNYTKETGEWAGTFVKDADKLVLDDLKERGLLFEAIPFEHSYPFCWRCDTPLLYYAIDTWFIKMSALRDRLVKNNNTVNWMPENIKDGRFGNFLENVIDWGLSRSRYWGTPLPVWECECGHFHTIGSIEELKKLGNNVPEDIELHKPYIDEITIKCDECGKEMHRVPYVIDCWFDSGSMPFAQYHYPFENKELFEKHFPAQFISEAIDQTRGWFYTLMAISTLIFDRSPFENCLVLGHVQDKDGLKMSKHKGNVVDPWSVLNKQGADAVRWYFCASSAPWLPTRFYDDGVSEYQRKFMGTFWNTYAFYVLYADIDKFNPMDYKLEYEKLSQMDKWALSKLNSLIQFVDESMTNYGITESSRAIQDFVDELSNWYVRRCRDRFWAKGMEQDKINAYMTLYTCLVTLAKVCAPFVPFMTEEIYQNLVVNLDKNAPESIHLCDFPVANQEYIDKKLEENMELVLDIVTLGRSCRNVSNIKNRQVLSKAYVGTKRKLDEAYYYIIKEELNVKEIEFVEDASEFVSYNVKPNLKTVGPKCGKLLPKINEMLRNGDGTAYVRELKANGKVVLDVEGVSIELLEEDLLVETTKSEKYIASQDADVTVVLDIELNEALIEEGFVRELISKIQNLRKDSGFEVQNHIEMTYFGNEKLAEIIERNKAQISDETLSDKIEQKENDGTELDINGEKITVKLVVCA
ncbi:MAG: isoleucine--tRNA ligase [Clostridia bacterium]|nr:isoleucine--tRNA ligase [Clostridia bacterium]